MADSATLTPALHDVRFPNESAAYRDARNELLQAEIDLRRRGEQVAALRRRLPPGGEIAQDYEFEGDEGPVQLSQLFGDKDTLVAYSYMYGPDMAQPCPYCTSMLDGLDGQAPHIGQRVSLAVIAKSPLARIKAFTGPRGWRHLRLFSSAANSYHRDYHGEAADGEQLPMLNVFSRGGDRIHHVFATEMFFAPTEPGQHPRHIDMIWPVWNVLDMTPDGRGESFLLKLNYD